ncbi:hypothetical protein V8D89_015096 [Ganoderma adspersum]
MSYPSKRRRTATSVLAGDFDPRPHRDVLTSLLNGVSMPKQTEEELTAKRERRREKKEKEKERRERERGTVKPDKKRVKAPEIATAPVPSTSGTVSAPTVVATKSASVAAPRPAASSFWQARPQIVIPNVQRSASFSPPPMPSSPPTTPGPSVSSRTSAVSSKRPFTPDDDDDDDDDDDNDDILGRQQSIGLDGTMQKKPRKKRPAARKGWKGWVEGSPPPSEKLINLDSVTVLAERKTRSGKSFDAIGAGRDGWV